MMIRNNFTAERILKNPSKKASKVEGKKEETRKKIEERRKKKGWL